MSGPAGVLPLVRAPTRDYRCQGVQMQIPEMDEALDTALEEHRVVGAVVLVAQEGERVYERAVGLADRERSVPMALDAVFRWSSLTKPVVAATAMALVERDVIRLDEAVTQWLPDFRPALADGTVPAITLDHLLTHTAGLTYGFADATGTYARLGISDGLDRSPNSLQDNVARIAQAPLLFPPGSAWAYSVAYDVLGAVIESATSRSLPAVVDELVTGPLAMASATFAAPAEQRLVTPYVSAAAHPEQLPPEDVPVVLDERVPTLLDGLPLALSPERIFDVGQLPSGGAGMAGTPGDLLTFLEAIRTGGQPILQSATVRQMLEPAVQRPVLPGVSGAFGRGWAVIIDPAREQSPLSAGSISWGGVYGHSWAVDLERRLTVVLLTNTSFEGMSGRLAADVLRAATSD